MTAIPSEMGATRHRAAKYRLIAAAVHLGITLLVAATLYLLISQVWYPSPFFSLAGGRHLLFLIFGCDLTLGPLLTLVVFEVRKPRRELVRDLAVIAIAQLLAMGYGLWTMLQARPVFIVYNGGQFNVTLANQMVKDPKFASLDASLPWLGPKLVAARLPTDARERTRLVFSSIEGRGDIYQMVKYFVPYDQEREDVKRRARTKEEVAADLHVLPAEIETATAQGSKTGARVGYLPVVVRGMMAIAAIDRDTGDLIGMAPLSK